jgi:hypothetical protein
MDSGDCVQFQPFSQYDWTFARVGWLRWKCVVYPNPPKQSYFRTIFSRLTASQPHRILPHRGLLCSCVLDVH